MYTLYYTEAVSEYLYFEPEIHTDELFNYTVLHEIESSLRLSYPDGFIWRLRDYKTICEGEFDYGFGDVGKKYLIIGNVDIFVERLADKNELGRYKLKYPETWIDMGLKSEYGGDGIPWKAV